MNFPRLNTFFLAAAMVASMTASTLASAEGIELKVEGFREVEVADAAGKKTKQTVPLAGALLQQVVGIDRYTLSAYLMIGIPILTGLALGAALFRSRRDPLVVLTTLLARAACARPAS